MSFHNHQNTQTNRNSIPHIAAFFASDTTNSIHSGVSNLTDNTRHNSQATNRSNGSSSLRRDREREGRCANCGAQTHEIRYDRESDSTKKIPLNIEGEVHRGRCLLCNPLVARSLMQRHQLQQQEHIFGGSNRNLEDKDDLESVHPRGSGSATQQYHLRDTSFNWRVSSQASHSSSSRSHDSEIYQENRQNPQQGPGAREYGIPVGSAQSYNSAPVFRGVTGSHQVPGHHDSITYPLATQSALNLSQNAAPPSFEEFPIDSSGGENLRQHQPQQQYQQPQHYRGIHSAINRSSNLNHMSIDDNQRESHESHSTGSRHPQQQELPYNEEFRINEILSSMQRSPYHIPTQSKSLHSLWVLSWENTNASTIGRLGGVPLIINSMRLPTGTAALRSNGIATLENLVIDTQNRDKIIKLDGVAVITDVMAQFLEDKAIQRSGCTALANLANGSTEQKRCVAERGGILAMMRAVHAHSDDERILRAAYQALRKLGYNPGS